MHYLCAGRGGTEAVLKRSEADLKQGEADLKQDEADLNQDEADLKTEEKSDEENVSGFGTGVCGQSVGNGSDAPLLGQLRVV